MSVGNYTFVPAKRTRDAHRTINGRTLCVKQTDSTSKELLTTSCLAFLTGTMKVGGQAVRQICKGYTITGETAIELEPNCGVVGCPTGSLGWPSARHLQENNLAIAPKATVADNQ